MVLAQFSDPESEEAAECGAVTVEMLDDLVSRISELESGRGHPVLQFVAPNDASIALGVSLDRAFLMLADPSGGTCHSTGGEGGTFFVVDYFGAFTEIPFECFIPLGDAVECVRSFLASGGSAGGGVLFAPD